MTLGKPLEICIWNLPFSIIYDLTSPIFLCRAWMIHHMFHKYIFIVVNYHMSCKSMSLTINEVKPLCLMCITSSATTWYVFNLTVSLDLVFLKAFLLWGWGYLRLFKAFQRSRTKPQKNAFLINRLLRKLLNNKELVSWLPTCDLFYFIFLATWSSLTYIFLLVFE